MFASYGNSYFEVFCVWRQKVLLVLLQQLLQISLHSVELIVWIMDPCWQCDEHQLNIVRFPKLLEHLTGAQWT